jgi:hypothetical protein
VHTGEAGGEEGVTIMSHTIHGWFLDIFAYHKLSASMGQIMRYPVLHQRFLAK